MRAAASRGLFGASLGGLSYLFYKHTELQGIVEAEEDKLVLKAHSLIQDDQKGLEVAEAALVQFREQHYKRGEAIALDQIASVLYSMRRPMEALEHAIEALDLIKSLEDLPWEAIMLHSVAALHCTVKHFPESLQAAQEAIWILEDIGDRSGQAYVRLNTVLLRPYLGHGIELTE
eukprot:g3977.t1